MTASRQDDMTTTDRIVLAAAGIIFFLFLVGKVTACVIGEPVEQPSCLNHHHERYDHGAH